MPSSPSTVVLQRLLLTVAMFHGPAVLAQHHFAECVSGTGNSAVILIEESSPVRTDGVPLQIGDEVAIFDAEGLCAGHLVWQEGGTQAITVWGEDPFLQTGAGLEEGEEMRYRVWSAERGIEIGGAVGIVEVAYDACEARPPICSPTGQYHSNAVYYLESVEAYIPTTGWVAPGYAPHHLTAYPNPFVDQTTVEVAVPRSGRVHVALVDVLGRVALPLFEGWMEAGRTYRLATDADALSPGTYVVHVQAARFSDTIAITYAL